MIGGGDYKAIPDSMFQCRELNTTVFPMQFQEKARMQYPRHGHSVASIADTYILVSGSRKEVSQASNKVELYDSQQDEWLEIQPISEGRHYHSSATFDNRFIYVFGGITNATKKYSNTIEMLQFSLATIQTAKWTQLALNNLAYYDTGVTPI